MQHPRIAMLASTLVVLAACETTDGSDGADGRMWRVSVICQATVQGDTVGGDPQTLIDTVELQLQSSPRDEGMLTDSVGGDPRPCYTTYEASTGTMMLNTKSTSDTAGGSPVD